MRDILKFMNILKVGASKDNYPLYCQLVNIENNKVRTCNDETYVELNLELGDVGNLNIYMLENILKMLPDEHEISTKGDSVFIKTRKSNYQLKLMDVTMPTFSNPTIDTVDLDEGLISILKLAQKFTGSSEYENIYMDYNGILATDTQKLLMYDNNLKIEKPVILTKKVISSLKENCKIGSDINDNTVVKFYNGFAVFVVPHYSTFPSERIRNWVNGIFDDNKDLIDVIDFREMLKKVFPVFVGESKRIINIKNNNFNFEINGKSSINGEIRTTGKSKLEDNFEININSDLFSSMPDDYTLRIKPRINNQIMASNGIANIVLIGEIN